jgi:ketopantoate reductase
MKTAILGAGAIGTLLAAYMVKGGAETLSKSD